MIDESKVLEHFAVELNKRMKTKRLASSDIANRCEIPIGSVSDYRKGRRLPNAWQMVLLAECLDCTVNDLLGFEGGVGLNKEKATERFYGENTYAEFLGARIYDRMEFIGIDAEQLAECAKISKLTINKWLRQWPSIPKTIHILRICETLDCTPSDLLGY